MQYERFDMIKMIAEYNRPKVSSVDTIVSFLGDNKTHGIHVEVMYQMLKKQNTKTWNLIRAGRQHPALFASFSDEDRVSFYLGCVQAVRLVANARGLYWNFKELEEEKISESITRGIEYLYKTQNACDDPDSFQKQILVALSFSTSPPHFIKFLRNIMFSGKGNLYMRGRYDSFMGIGYLMKEGLAQRALAMRMFGICVQTHWCPTEFSEEWALEFVQKLETVVSNCSLIENPTVSDLRHSAFQQVSVLCPKVK